ncbi:hypothetical protein RMI40_31255 [Pseudomonas protegens]|uniref:hypothetical protein n=1 Tax=Pseudomonas protegens TaxID=380021 RepID=UPI00287E8DEE|nr:hypothetical protein [Pseudomonas protegens]MDS9879316.1 hypothetical protein [Pseudomonas protegens]
MSAQQQVIKIDDISADNAPVIYVTGGLGQFFDAVQAEVAAEVPDLTTRKGRERIASLAAKVSKSKSAVEKPGRDYLKRLKEMPKVVEAELREFVNKMDALRDETRRPLTEWEEAEDRRVAAHEQAIDRIKSHGVELGQLASEDLLDRIGKIEAVALGDSWEEFAAEAGQVKDQVLSALRDALTARQKYEDEQAELARLRADAEAREQKDREERIAREAAERARIDAEHKAQAEREATQRREQKAKAAAEHREMQLKLQAEQAERARIQAEADRVAAEQRMEQERQAAARRQEEAAEQARQDERRRADAAAAEILRQQEAREADKAHRASINRAALEAFMAEGMPEACAKQAVTLIAQRKIPNIAISY